MTHPEKIEELLNGEKVTFYIGFDATADSLHVGHFLQMVVMKRLQQAGHRPIALLGTGTTMVLSLIHILTMSTQCRPALQSTKQSSLLKNTEMTTTFHL